MIDQQAIKTSFAELRDDAIAATQVAVKLQDAAILENIPAALELAAKLKELADKIESEAHHLEDLNQ